MLIGALLSSSIEVPEGVMDSSSWSIEPFLLLVEKIFFTEQLTYESKGCFEIHVFSIYVDNASFYFKITIIPGNRIYAWCLFIT